MKVLLITLCFFGLVWSSANLPNSLDLADDYTINWGFTSDGTSIIITLEYTHQAWVGIGWKCLGCTNDHKMKGADYVTVSFQDGRVSVDDRFGRVLEGMPDLDTDIGGTNDIKISSAFQVDGFTSVTFSRKLVTNDTKADHPIVDGSQKVLWAHGDLTAPDPNVFNYHGQTNRGGKLLNLMTGIQEAEGTPLAAWHGSIMFMAYAVLMSFGIFVARFLKDYYWWFPLHIIVQTLAVILSLVGFGLAIVMAEGSHFSNLHRFVCLQYM